MKQALTILLPTVAVMTAMSLIVLLRTQSFAALRSKIEQRVPKIVEKVTEMVTEKVSE